MDNQKETQGTNKPTPATRETNQSEPENTQPSKKRIAITMFFAVLLALFFIIGGGWFI